MSGDSRATTIDGGRKFKLRRCSNPDRLACLGGLTRYSQRPWAVKILTLQWPNWGSEAAPTSLNSRGHSTTATKPLVMHGLA